MDNELSGLEAVEAALRQGLEIADNLNDALLGALINPALIHTQSRILNETVNDLI